MPLNKIHFKSEWKVGVSGSRYRVSFQDNGNILELDSDSDCMAF